MTDRHAAQGHPAAQQHSAAQQLTDPQAIAESACRQMLARDRVSAWLGLEVVRVAPGQAVLAMKVTDALLNGVDTCHGGILAALADSAFAVACNSHGKVTVASGFTVDFIAPVRAGDVLTAEAREISLSRRTGVYDVTLTNQRHRVVATFRGRSARLESSHPPAHGLPGRDAGNTHPA